MEKIKIANLKKPIKTIYSKRGYALIKKHFSSKKLSECRKKLTVKPFIPDDYNIMKGNDSFPIYLESPKKIYLPKHYGFSEFGEPDEIKINKGSKIDVEFRGKLNPLQEEIVECYMKSCEDGEFAKQSRGGIISVGCGIGKTVIGIHIASLLGVKTLIIVHKEFLVNQWKERLSQFLPDAKIGIIQAKKCEVQGKDVVIGMLQSLSMKEYDEEIFDDFGLTIVDECHHISSEVFSRALPKINTYYTLGLSATPKRNDGLHDIFHMYLGPFVYKMEKKPDRVVRVNVVKFYDDNPDYSKEEITAFGKLCIPRVINNIVDNMNRNMLIVSIIKQMVQVGRKMILLSDRISHLNALNDMTRELVTQSTSFYIGGMKERDLKKSEEAQVIFSTYSMAAEGLDIPALNTAIFVTPKSSIEQSIGRITRRHNEEYPPLAYDIVDNFCVFPNQYNKREVVYKKLGYDVYTKIINSNQNHKLEYFDMKLDEPWLKRDFSKKKKQSKLDIKIEETNDCMIMSDNED